ncbi:HNH endonuclease, partial [Streptomyces sp. NPDC059233]
MIKNLSQRGLPALALSVLPLLATAVPAHAADGREGLTSSFTVSAVRESGSLFEGIDRIPAAPESREGYVRTAFKHWNAGAIADDGCNTRAEAILEEAVERPEVAPGCKLTGGKWFSLYD